MSTCSGCHDAGHKHFSLQGRYASCPLTVSSLAESPTNHSRNLGGPMTRYDFWCWSPLVVQKLVGAICMDLINIHASSYRSQLSFQQQKKRHIFKAKKSSDKTIQLDWMTLVWTAWKSLPFSWSMHDFWLHEIIHQWQGNCSNSWSSCLWSQEALTFKEHFLPEKLGTKLWTDKPFWISCHGYKSWQDDKGCVAKVGELKSSHLQNLSISKEFWKLLFHQSEWTSFSLGHSNEMHRSGPHNAHDLP